MEDSSSSTKDSYSILGITKAATIKDMCKAYKSLVAKWNPDKNPSNKNEAEAKFKEINGAYKVLNGRKLKDLLANEEDPTATGGAHSHHKSVDDIGFFSVRSSFLSRSTSRRSQTPTPTRSYLSRCQSKSSSTTPRMKSTPATPTSATTTKFPTAPTSPTPTPESSTNKNSESRSKSTSRRSASEIPSVLSRNASRRSTTPIIFSQSTARRKPPPVEKMHCTLEDLCFGCVKRVNITKDVIMDGIIVKEHEVLKINIQPGWKTGTKITFEGKGDERPGNLPADIIFSIEEERHPLFKRNGDDLELMVQIPLVEALTGCSLTVPLLGGERMSLSFDDILYPGYEKVVPGQGMPTNTDDGQRGDLRLKFLIEFPKHLSHKQRSQAYTILRECS